METETKAPWSAPLPWSKKDGYIDCIADAHETIVLQVRGDSEDLRRRIPQILCAVNNHDPLVAVCRKSLDCLEEILEDTDGPDGGRIHNPLLTELRAVIAKAEGYTK